MGFVPLETLIADYLVRYFVLIDREVATLVGAAGMMLLGLSWWKRAKFNVKIAQLGWILVGFYFFNQAWTYLEHDDPILTVLTAGTLPLCCLVAWWEQSASGARKAVSYTHLTLPTKA